MLCILIDTMIKKDLEQMTSYLDSSNILYLITLETLQFSKLSLLMISTPLYCLAEYCGYGEVRTYIRT